VLTAVTVTRGVQALWISTAKDITSFPSALQGRFFLVHLLILATSGFPRLDCDEANNIPRMYGGAFGSAWLKLQEKLHWLSDFLRPLDQACCRFPCSLMSWQSTAPFTYFI
jgi:hypothetical protein